ncbi:VHS domain-containing protein [Rhodocollybia butyracea]|uniref:VHS domain-containing protein n=1 Tax=Rhodocollybia butyracea TaxID=206335 RepID=A0A9P5P983_9AGAR|nr:VHS domain-containing protein [Rhodocollybia butyracea]
MLQSPTASSWTRVSQLEVLITRACDPSLPEPNFAAHIEVAEYINSKKANNPREAAMTIARLANNRNPHISMLSLALLDTLTQSCGYPFHLQISTKEFLNELVRRFPERPPPYPNAVMSRILELIHGWKEGICTESRWKEDLGNIRDMHRLLTFKGYRFRDFAPRGQREIGATSTANLKTATELETEDREAQSAKLQELIRRGTPRDLAAAQELMKALAGANPDAKPDYRSQALNEINKLESKVILLNEMLDNVDTERGERFVQGDAYDQVASILSAARPKLQKWVSEAGSSEPDSDSESLDTFLQMNDQINTVLNRYEAFKTGDYSFAANPIPAELSNATAGLSLIDLAEGDSANGSTAGNGAAPGGQDLMGLFGPSNTMPVMESRIGLGLPGMNVGTSTPPIPATHTPPIYGSPMASQSPPMYSSPMSTTGLNSSMGIGYGVPSFAGTPSINSIAQRSMPFSTPRVPSSTSSPAPPSQTPSYFLQQGSQAAPASSPMSQFGVSSQSTSSRPMQTPPVPTMRSFSPQTQSPPAPASAAATQPQKDPFADLAGLF